MTFTIDAPLLAALVALIVAIVTFIDRGRRAAAVESSIQERLKVLRNDLSELENRNKEAEIQLVQMREAHHGIDLVVARLAENSEATKEGIAEIKKAIQELSKSMTEHIVQSNGNHG